MQAPYDAAGELTKLTRWIDSQLDDETASRQYIAEQASARLRDITGRLTGSQERPRRRPDLLGCEPSIAQALADAIRWRLTRAATGPKRSRRGEAEQIGLYLMAAGQLGLTQQLGGIIDVAKVQHDLGIEVPR